MFCAGIGDFEVSVNGELQLFAAIDENVRTGTSALRHTLLQAKAQAARSPSVMDGSLGPAGRETAVENAARVAHLLLAAQYEARLAWLTWHPDSRLDASQKREALKGGFADRWKTLLRLALSDRLQRRDPPISISPHTFPRGLPPADRARYYDLNGVARKYLNPLIDTRNSLAHGEWVTALTRSADGLNAGRTAELGKISIFRVTVLANLLDHYWKCYFDALVTHRAFERDFPIHHRRMMHAADRLERASESRWLANLRKRFVDGRSSNGGLTQPPPVPQVQKWKISW